MADAGIPVRREVGDALSFPGASIGKDFAWTSAHPVVDAYRGFKAMPYDAPSHDLAAVYFASQPEAEFFQLSEPGSVTVSDAGRVYVRRGWKRDRQESGVAPARRAQALQAFVEIAKRAAGGAEPARASSGLTLSALSEDFRNRTDEARHHVADVHDVISA